jgi:sigma-B regulation protein RsbU (phosphoserine phosphatase)
MYQEVLEKKQAEKEIGVAGEIQSSLIPHSFPDTDKYEMYGFSIPAKGVGGDYYDYIDFGNNKIAMTMFDVSGKGVPAALIMVMIRSILRTIASLDAETKHILERLNDTIAQEIVEDRYATGFYLLYDAEKGLMNYTNAGHGPLILYRASEDTFHFLDTEGMPVGIMPGVTYGQDFVTLESGDLAILYTDGITEAMNLQHEEFGMERLQNVIRTYKRESAREIANKILEEVNRFVGTAPQHDDETLLILKAK